MKIYNNTPDALIVPPNESVTVEGSEIRKNQYGKLAELIVDEHETHTD